MESKSYIEEIKRYLNRNLDKGYHLEDLKIQLRKKVSSKAIMVSICQ